MQDFRSDPKAKKAANDFSDRRKVLVVIMLAFALVLVGKAAELHIFKKDFLQGKGEIRQLGKVVLPANRGMMVDRNGVPLAVSAPVASIKISPKEIQKDDENLVLRLNRKYKKEHKLKKLTESDRAIVIANYHQSRADKLKQMATLLNLPTKQLDAWLHEVPLRANIYIAKRIDPHICKAVKELDIAGVYFEHEFKRFYPSADISAHLLGFTDANEEGQVGLELAYQRTLQGTPGLRHVIKDGKGQIIADVKDELAPLVGKSLELTIDQRLQYLAYKELQAAVALNKAKAGTLVLLDAKNGDVLAVANQPSFNPNIKENIKEAVYRNRALTEVFEPGSTVKPFIVAAGLEGGYVHPGDHFATRGVFKIGDHTVKDVHNYGTMDLTKVIKKSSNIAVSQMALRMPPKYLWDTYHKLGFGVSAKAGFPQEARGTLSDYHKWHDFDRAIMSFGYGFNASALQLARAYTALADDGIMHSVSLLKRDEDNAETRVFSAATAKRVREMMETVIMKDGTAYEARIDGYSVAGKTGTVKKSVGKSGYADKKYFSVFAGMAPAKDPRLVMVVMIDEPGAKNYYGGLVSAPVFSKVMGGALRMLNIAPDKEDTMPVLLTQAAAQTH